MRKAFFFCLAGVLLFVASSMAQDKVVVIPMGSSAKGTDGQVQYNDNGRTAGAEVYYDKATGKLELPGEFRTIDGAGNNRLWGKGRPGTRLLTHTDPNGYCTTSEGIKHALSYHLETWGNADNVCPAGTWVCSMADLPAPGYGGACPIVPITTFQSFNCLGEANPAYPPGEQTSLIGWITDSDIYFGDLYDVIRGIGKGSSSWDSTYGTPRCNMYRAWCCWE